MSTKRPVGRFTATHKKDRSGLCAFTFADGRQCRTPRRSGHPHLCYFHAQKEAQAQAARQVGEDISRFLPAKLLTACDLSGAMARVFCAIARGDVKPKVASTLAYLSQSMVQSIPIAQHEYCEAFGSDAWRTEIRSSFNVPAPQPKHAPQPTPKPAPKPPASLASAPTAKPCSSPAPQPPVNCHSARPDPVGERSEEPASSLNSSLATHHSPLPPAPSPHTPLPPTSAEFAQQVLAGRNSSRSEIPTPSGPGRENGSSGSSSSPAPSFASSSTDSAPARTSSVQPAPSSPWTLPTPTNSQPAPTPPAPQPTETPANCRSSLATHHSPLPHNPPPVPPAFGAPANWDVLIPPKPRRRFSRHWQLPE
jgi:hypothetical protein